MRFSFIDPELEQLIRYFSRLPGFGPRSAQRAALFLLKRKETVMKPFLLALETAYQALQSCIICGNLGTNSTCSICQSCERDSSVLIIVEDIGTLWALERTGRVKNKYHVLGGHLSPLNGIRPEDLRIPQLLERIELENVKEIILAISVTVEGQTTAHYLIDQLAHFNLKITKLAQGVPIGGDLDYIDDNTLFAALEARTLLGNS